MPAPPKFACPIEASVSAANEELVKRGAAESTARGSVAWEDMGLEKTSRRGEHIDHWTRARVSAPAASDDAAILIKAQTFNAPVRPLVVASESMKDLVWPNRAVRSHGVGTQFSHRSPRSVSLGDVKRLLVGRQ